MEGLQKKGEKMGELRNKTNETRLTINQSDMLVNNEWWFSNNTPSPKCQYDNLGVQGVSKSYNSHEVSNKNKNLYLRWRLINLFFRPTEPKKLNRINYFSNCWNRSSQRFLFFFCSYCCIARMSYTEWAGMCFFYWRGWSRVENLLSFLR